MLSLLFAICMIWFVGKFFVFGLRASWGIMKLLCTVIFFPVILIGMVIGGLMYIALIMDVPKNKLGLQGEEVLEVVNFKCDPILIGTLREEPGFFPAYHMSKDSWITVALDGSVSDDKIKMLLDTSYEATASKTHKKC